MLSRGLPRFLGQFALGVRFFNDNKLDFSHAKTRVGHYFSILFSRICILLSMILAFSQSKSMLNESRIFLNDTPERYRSAA